MTEFNYNDIIEYIDGTYDENFQNAKHWAENHNTSYEEIIDMREEKDGVLYRYWQIGPEPQPYVPTYDDIKLMRSMAYVREVDPITAHIQRLRDQNPQPEGEIAQLIAERDAKFIEIQERYPYPEENIGEIV